MKSLAICSTGLALALVAAAVLSSEPAAAQQASTPADIDQSNGRTLDEQLLAVAGRVRRTHAPAGDDQGPAA